MDSARAHKQHSYAHMQSSSLQSQNMHKPHFVVYSWFYVFYNYNLIFQNMYSLTFSLWF